MLNLSGLENSRQPIGEHDTPPISSMAAKPAHVTGMDITPPLASRPISLLVGFSDDGQPIYAHIAFDVPVRKGYLSRLGDQLKAMESVAESTAKQK